jgi:hypothetical protein
MKRKKNGNMRKVTEVRREEEDKRSKEDGEKEKSRIWGRSGDKKEE